MSSSEGPSEKLQVFPPIGDYGLIGDCRTAALVSRNGAIEWLCVPDFSSPSIFASVLDRAKGGYLQIRPVAGECCERRYRDRSATLETDFRTERGAYRVIDFFPISLSKRLEPQREVLRIIEVLDGEPEIEIMFAPRADYGHRELTIERRGELGWTANDRASLYLVRSDVPLVPAGRDHLIGRTKLQQGRRRYLSFSVATRDPAVIPCLGSEADQKLYNTDAWWKRWSSHCHFNGSYREAVLRSLLTLKMLQYCLSGAVIAAPTTSLPETVQGERNWDYRYCWLRDASFMLRAFADTGFGAEGAAFFGWMLHATRLTQPMLQPIYDVFGRTELDERRLEHLYGYKASRPVRIGNAAHNQLQLDVYGAVITAACEFVARGFELDLSEQRLLRNLGRTVCRCWREPDNGIWEFRHLRRHNTWSKVMCWATLDCLLKLDLRGFISVPREQFTREKNTIREATLKEAWSESLQSFTGAFGEDFLDATLLLLPRCGFIAADDPRMLSTWKRVQERLARGVLLRRYEQEADVLSGYEGTFVTCAFWAVEYLARAGQVSEAKERFEMLLGYANDLGLYSEEVSLKGRELLGNFPQAFSHSGLVNAALAISEAQSS